MKLIIFLFVFVCSASICLPAPIESNSQQRNDSSYFPAQVGNTWYIKTISTYPSWPTYYKVIKFTEDTKINGKLYFHTTHKPEFWFREEGNKIFMNYNDTDYVYMDFDLPVGATYDLILKFSPLEIVTAKVVQTIQDIFGTQVICKGFEYNDNVYPPHFGNYYSEYYAKGYGMVYGYESMAGPGVSLTYRSKVFQAIIYDSTSYQYYHTPFSFYGNASVLLDDFWNMHFNLKVSHAYNIFPYSPLSEWISFVDSFHFEFRWVRGSDTVINFLKMKANPIAMPDSFLVSLLVDQGLFFSGFTELLYSIKVLDKSLIPETITIPDSGFNSLRLYNKKVQLYPLSVGNEWVFDKKYLFAGGSWVHERFVKRKVLNDTIIDGVKYFIVEDFDKSLTFERIDSVTASTYRANLDSGGIREVLLDSTMVPLNNTFRSFRFIQDTTFKVVELTNDFITYKSVISDFYYKLNKNIGLSELYIPGDYSPNFLTYCYFFAAGRINGVNYGDTTLLDVNEKEDVFDDFVLFPNYPNPFNPETVISYQLPVNSKVTLGIYDILGREVARLVDEEQEAGNYEVKFNGNKLASGVYIYRITAGDFVMSNKMILMK